MKHGFPVRRLPNLLGLFIVLVSFPALSLAADAGVGDAGIEQRFDGGSLEVDARIARIRERLVGTLSVAIDPQSLFDVPLNDEPAVQVERFRLEAMLRALDESADAGAARVTKTKPKPVAAPSRTPTSVAPPVTYSAQWRDREQLDQARLSFYSLTKEARESLLETQARRVEAAKPKETAEERRAREAEEERAKALEAARQARTEAERLVAKELARIIELERDVAGVRERFKAAGIELASRKDSLLGWQKRVTDAKATPGLADETYDSLRRTLRASRDELERALDVVDSSGSAVPEIGPDPLSDIPSDVSTEAVLARRRAAEKQIDAARQEERSLRAQRASALLDEIDALNRDRLSLLGSLSLQKRAGITGFTQAGFDQSRSEARQLFLILRYHRYVALGWLGDLRRKQGIAGSPFGASLRWPCLGFWLSLLSSRCDGEARSGSGF